MTVTTPVGSSPVSSADSYSYGDYAQTVRATAGCSATGGWGNARHRPSDELGAITAPTPGGYTLGSPGALLGDPNTAASFDGTSGYVHSARVGTAANWTIEGWTKLNEHRLGIP